MVERLGSSSVGPVADIHITESGAAKIDFFTADAARKLQHLIRGENFIVDGKKVKEMALQVSVLPLPQDPLASRVLMLTGMHEELPVLDSGHVKFILRQNDHVCPWVATKRLSSTRTGVHFSSWREAEKATQILQSHFPGIHIRYAIDPATGDNEPSPSFLLAILTGTDLPDTNLNRSIRYTIIILTIHLFSTILLHFYEQ